MAEFAYDHVHLRSPNPDETAAYYERMFGAQVIKSVMAKLEKHGKGIVLMHDFQRATAEALPELLNQLKANGYKIVHMVPKAPMQTIARYDEMVIKENKLPTVSTRPTDSVVRTISEMPR